jgi:hypothetical protein
VWWNVLRQDDAKRDAQADGEACATAGVVAAVDPATITLRVFNATDEAGLAGTVATEMQTRGFAVDEVANDPSDREVTGPGEIRHGPRGAEAAAYLALYLPGATTYEDTRATEIVDLVLGPEYAGLASADEVAAAASPTAGAPGC